MLKIVCRTMLITLLSAFLMSCSDNRKEIAMSLLFPGPSNTFNSDSNKAVTAALSARFPAGSPVNGLTSFIKSLGGGCWNISQSDQHGVVEFDCSIPEVSGFMQGSALEIKFDAQNDNIKTIQAQSGGGTL